MKSIAFVLERAQASRNAQAEFASQWVWPEKTVIQWDTDIAALKAAQIAELQARVAYQNNTEQWDALLAEVETTCRKVVRLAKTRFRNDSVKFAMFAELTITKSSRDRIYNTAREILEVWDNVDGTWEPIPGIVMGGLGSMLGNSDAKKTVNQRLYTTWRRKALEQDAKARNLDELNVAWYSDATTRFSEGTMEGDLIRSTVPTTTEPVEAVGQAVISHLIVNNGTIHFDWTAPHASRYTVLHRTPGTPEYVVLHGDTTETSITLENQSPGVHWFKAFGVNSQGDGPESVPVSIEVPAAAIAA